MKVINNLISYDYNCHECKNYYYNTNAKFRTNVCIKNPKITLIYSSSNVGSKLKKMDVDKSNPETIDFIACVFCEDYESN